MTEALKSPVERDGYWLSMPGARRGTFGLVGVCDCGIIEVELCERSSGISTLYGVAKEHLPVLAERLAIGFGGEVPGLDALPDRLTTFLDVQSLICWLTVKSGVPVSKRVYFQV
ncbi:hypothetical protein [Ottowia sp. VDI28]|uniref:hypothetical protein n=1 Tax=Ottowia sp. VDI28 TaxID=3133968 RepID=UPI003C2DF0CF